MFFKKILFFIFLISSVSIPGYYFYQRSQSKKEESYPVNNKEEIKEEIKKEEPIKEEIKKDEKEEVQKEEPIQEEIKKEEPIQEEKKEEEPTIKNEEVSLVEINGWLDCLLVNTLFYFLMTGFLYLLFVFKMDMAIDMAIVKELNKVTNDQLKGFFLQEQINIGEDPDAVKDKIDKIAPNFHEFDPENEKNDETVQQFNCLGVLYLTQFCFENDKFFWHSALSDDFIESEYNNNLLNLEMNFPRIFFIISFIIIQIILRYDLYFFLKSFWQVGFQKTFNNFNWSDLFSIEKVFRRNSIMKKIAFLVTLIFITGVTFVLASKFYEEKYAIENVLSSMKDELQKKLDNGDFESYLSEEQCRQIKTEKLANHIKKPQP